MWLYQGLRNNSWIHVYIVLNVSFAFVDINCALCIKTVDNKDLFFNKKSSV